MNVHLLGSDEKSCQIDKVYHENVKNLCTAENE